MKVIAVNGSPRVEGNTFQLIRKVLEKVESEGLATELVQIGGKPISGCTACGKCFQTRDSRCINNNDVFNEVFSKIIKADGIIFGSPTYFTDVTAELKALIDRTGFVALANGGLLRHKAGAAVVAVRRGGGTHAFDTINHLFQMNQMFIVGSTYWNLGYGLNPGDVMGDSEGLANMDDLANSMCYLLKKLNSG